jgi:hypothetical protein
MCPNLKVLRNFIPCIRMRPEALGLALGTFPNLKTVTIPVRAVGDKAICEFLNVLSISCGSLQNVEIAWDRRFGALTENQTWVLREKEWVLSERLHA